MSILSGSSVLIQVGSGGMPETFATLGGLRTSDMQVRCRGTEASGPESGVWQKLSPVAGLLAMSLKGSGAVTGSAADETLRGYVFAGTPASFRFVFASGAHVTGSFLVLSYQRWGDHDGEESYAIYLESAGTLHYVP